jgi:hypothetical protein
MNFIVILERTPSLNAPVEQHTAETCISDKVEIEKGRVYIYGVTANESITVPLEECMALWVDRVLLVKRCRLIGPNL